MDTTRTDLPHADLSKASALLCQEVLPFLLAGGRGSRLSELTDDECKPALPLIEGPRGLPVRMVDFTMANLQRSGFDRVMVATQYRPATLQAHLERRWGSAFARRVRILDGEAICPGLGYLGTGHAVAANRAAIEAESPRELLILSGDHVYEMDYAPLVAAHRASGAGITVVVTEVDLTEARAFGVVATDPAGQVVDFAEKPDHPRASDPERSKALVSIGVYVADWAWLRGVLDRNPDEADFGHDILPQAVASGRALAFRLPPQPGQDEPYWRDVGSLDSLRQTLLDLTSWPAPCGIPLGGPMQGRAAPLVAQRGREGLDYAFACAVGPLMLGAPRFGRRLGRRWTVLDESVILPGGRVMPGARLSRAIVAPGAVVPSTLVVGEDPVEDARWFRRSEGGTVLITQAMLQRRLRAQLVRDPLRALRLRHRLPGAVSLG